MGVMANFFKRFRFSPSLAMPQRQYAAAAINRLTSNWVTTPLSVNAELRTSLRTMRARARELAQNNDYAKRFLWQVETNVIGPNGIQLQNKSKDLNGLLDRVANKKIESAWVKWGASKACDVAGTKTWHDLERLFIKSVARDGEVLIRRVRGYPNEYQYAIQILEADHLDENYNLDNYHGNRIDMGVERDKWGRPIAYHVTVKHPGENTYSFGNQRYERVLANEIIHAFVEDRPTQTRGVPWMHSAMTRLNMLGGYEEAEVVAARIAACKMGFFELPGGEEYTGSTTEDGAPITEAEPGVFEALPAGMKFSEFKPDHPAGNFGPFVKSVLRGISSGLNVSYNTLASDLEGVNYSSIRAGVLDERDGWRCVQKWTISHFHEIVYQDWLPMAMLSNQIQLPANKMDKFNAPNWQPRGWSWVDPEKDMNAAILGIQNGLKSRTQILAELGVDLEDVYEALKIEDALAEQYNLTLAVPAIPYVQPVSQQSGAPVES